MDVVDVDLRNQSGWTNSGNWMGGTLDALVHELHHNVGLDDRYNYIRSHARNEGMTIENRLHWFKVQVLKKPKDPGGVADPDMTTSIMGYGEKLTDDDVCRAATGDKPWPVCVQARQQQRFANTVSTMASDVMVFLSRVFSPFF